MASASKFFIYILRILKSSGHSSKQLLTAMLPASRVNLESTKKRLSLSHTSPSEERFLLRNIRKVSRETRNKNVASLGQTLAEPFCQPKDKLLRLNIGGTSYLILTDIIVRGSRKALLYHFAYMDHVERLECCDAYLSDTDEYYFCRSAQVFECVYQYYISGHCHKPLNVCLEFFAASLTYWGLNNIQLAKCCWAVADDATVDAAEVDEFKTLRYGACRRYVWQLIDVPESSALARFVSFVSVVAVLASNVGLVLGSLKPYQVIANETWVDDNNETQWMVKVDSLPVLNYLETVCIIWFTTEYLARLLVAPNRCKVFCKGMNIIDLIAILPFYLEMALNMLDLSNAKMQEFKGALLVVRILRVLRAVRLFMVSRYSSGLQTFARTMERSREQLSMLVVVLATGVMFFSTLVYYLEKDQPGTKFQSIPDSFWWCIVTMTTVGYGDMFPETIPGKVVGSFCITSGILVLALPLTVIVENFMQVQDERRQEKCTNETKKEFKF